MLLGLQLGIGFFGVAVSMSDNPDSHTYQRRASFLPLVAK